MLIHGGECCRFVVGSALFKVLLIVALLVGGIDVHAQGATYHYEYADSLASGNGVLALSDSPFGESISYIEGATNFSSVDVSAVTQAKLPMIFGRKWNPSKNRFRNISTSSAAAEERDFQVMGSQWELDAPSLSGIYPSADGWVTGAKARCSGGMVTPQAIPIPSSPPMLPYNFWYGFNANIPGYGAGKIYSINSGTVVPADGNVYKFATLNGWRISCLNTIKNGVGEGFVVVLPDGAKYYFDWVAVRPVSDLQTPYATVKRGEVFFFATKAVDRFGNEVSYTYDPVKPMRLTKISASDGVEISISYDANGRVVEVISGGRVWRYNYALIASGPSALLTEVVQPDGYKWKFEGPDYVSGSLTPATFGSNCNYSPGNFTSDGDRAISRIKITHPSGVVGEFFFKSIAHGYNNVTLSSCNPDGSSSTSLIGRPKAYLFSSLISKKIYGPGLPYKEWNIRYSPSWSYESECMNGCPNTSTTIVTTNDGETEIFVYGNDFKSNANQLISHSILENGVLLRRVDRIYLMSVSGQPFPDYIAGAVGEEVSYSLDNSFLRRNRPLIEETTYQDGVIFKAQVNQFDSFVYPVNITRSSVLGSIP